MQNVLIILDTPCKNIMECLKLWPAIFSLKLPAQPITAVFLLTQTIHVPLHHYTHHILTAPSHRFMMNVGVLTTPTSLTNTTPRDRRFSG